ncbi:MAG TPA: chromosome segregation protein SMC [Opitutaceae bacterium]|jgi:chromosome segregation protein
MYLKALRLHGFKSFADQTTLSFEPGVTAVVGPNGCGKSNIADSIRWVLGEQSAKALRGSKMQDVIFEGADTRRPAQMCEVSLLLTECEKQLGSEFHEVEITRRVYRDGQGEYLFNGQACRLKDIHKLFMDTGVGRTSYSIMAQGHIDQVLSSKPEERRAVFEEAAGITRYKSQRREAMGKLALTDQNLARVADVVGEVGRQIGSLRRQAAKAMRYKRLAHRLRHLSLAWSSFQHAELAAALTALETSLSGLRAEAQSRRAALEGQQSGLEARKADRSRLNQRVQDAQQAVYDLRSQREHAENAANMARIRGTGLSERLDGSRDSIGELEMQLREVASQVDTGSQDRQMQLGLLGSSDAVYQQHNRELAVSEGELGRLERDLQQAKFELLQFDSAVARLRTEASGYEVDQKTSLLRHGALAGEHGQAAAGAAAAAAAAQETAARSAEALLSRNAANEAAAEAQRAVTEATREFREAQRKIQENDRHMAQRGARLRLLQQLQERMEGFGEGAKAILQGRLSDTLGGARAVPVSQGIDVKAEFGRAVEALLGSAAEAIDVADLATARRILSRLESEQIGSVILRVGELGHASHEAPALPEGLIPATAALALPDDAHPARAVLSSCYIADDLGAFLDFWRQNPAFAFLSVATRRGEVVDRRGLVSGGHSASKRQTGGIVQREIDLRETARALAEDQKLADELKAQSEALNARISAAEQSLEERRAGVIAATQALAAAQAEERAAKRAAEDAAARAQRMEAELAELDRARRDAQARWEKAVGGLAESEAAAVAQRGKIDEHERRLTAVRGERDVKRDALAQARLELAERRQKVEVLDKGLGEMERRREQLNELLVERQQEIEAWTGQIADLEREDARQRGAAAQVAETLGVAQAQVEAIRADLVGAESEISTLESAQSALRHESDSAHDQLSAQEVKLAETRQRAAFLVEDVQREFQAEVASVDWKAMLWRSEDEPEGLKALDLDEEEEPDPAPRRQRKKRPESPSEEDLAAMDGTDWGAVKVEVDALRQRMGGMGAVNLVAIEEYSELRQRHDFLKNQSDDLAKARAELIAAIDEINRTSQKQFELTFEQIRKNFEYTFQTLFGGGRANIELVQSEDILESGIDIVAQPPGTKLKGISLLSGGQRTLTAVALLFALYLVKPSPFCLLDELDAPLDESNIGRFTELLKKFVKDSQFIIITHNKRTVASAKAIYGVTMEERGVSKTVSMRFNQEHGEAEAHQPVPISEAVMNAAPLAPAPAGA